MNTPKCIDTKAMKSKPFLKKIIFIYFGAPLTYYSDKGRASCAFWQQQGERDIEEGLNMEGRWAFTLLKWHDLPNYVYLSSGR
ncbi:hypothetical protein C4A76_03070 [Brevibacillus laterosporus]|uniref:Uncharacterized protein n=1 Tax=Brevibacillus laterosporus TaxID=1465 RepID=A0AAP8U7E4_BRELA|nr:hypothetical protein C4A76_03070 [Brevibacillus laterosporus]PPB13185.1 hypothetical protein C4A77_02075 [Brevibacillus laterosporus]